MLIFFVVIFMLSISVIISFLLFFLKRDTLVWKGWVDLTLFWNLNESQVEKSCIPCKSLENSNNTNFQSYETLCAECLTFGFLHFIMVLKKILQ
jgi:hypothetical protein